MTAPAWTLPAREEADAAARRLGPADAVVSGVLDIAGARALALDALLRLSAIEWNAEVETACVECIDRPRLLINPVFVERWCGTRERLAVLLMHELAHVSMGHTRLYPRPSAAQNIACDAVINNALLAVVSEQGGDVPRFAELFEEFYDSGAAPEFLLRPPPGWPRDPDWKASRGCPMALRNIHRRLYTTGRHTVMYAEIVEALRTAGAAGQGSTLVLLGGHGTTPLEQRIVSGGRDAAAAELLSEAMAALSGRFAGPGADPFAHQVARAARRAALERALATLLRRVFTTDGTRRNAIVLSERLIRTVDPRRDRRAPARMGLARAFGAPRPLLFDGAIVERRPAPRDATVYLDVSGSMFGVLPALHASLVPLRRVLQPRIHLFSTEVVRVRDADFDRGKLSTTGGTSISPVLEHAVAEARAASGRGSGSHRVLVLTDGYFERPSAQLARAVKEAGVRVHLAIAGGGPSHENAKWVASTSRLPAL